MRFSAIGKYYACNNTQCGGFFSGYRDGDIIYERAQTLYTYPAPGQPSWIPDIFNGETFTTDTTVTVSGCAPPVTNLVCNTISNSNQLPPPPRRQGPTTLSQPRSECALCTPAANFPSYWVGNTPITFWNPPSGNNPLPMSVDGNDGWFRQGGNHLKIGASIGYGGYLKNTHVMKWRFEHTFTPMCYLKVWFIKRIRTMDYNQSVLSPSNPYYAGKPDYLVSYGTIGTIIKENFPPSSTYEVLPYVYEWNPSQTPCIGKNGDSDDGDGGVINEYDGEDPYGEVISTNNRNAMYPIIHGAEQEVEDPIQYCGGPRTLSDIRIAVWKYSFVKGYEPDDPSYGWPFITPDTSGRTKLNGFPVQGDGYDGNVGFA
jgi:hypothetical protein